MKFSQIGVGVVGSALKKSFESRGINVVSYDKNKGIGEAHDVLDSNFCFLCLPTPFKEGIGFDKSAILDSLTFLSENSYSGLVVIKSTLEPGATDGFCDLFPSLKLCHNPEFLTARTAYFDFENQKHIVLGRSKDCSLELRKATSELSGIFLKLYPDAKVSICTSGESESMKIFCNSFYAMKVQIFNEFYLMCKRQNIDYNKVRDLMLCNEWINPMHTLVPGPDGKLSYGGECFPKDTCALSNHMNDLGSPSGVLDACIRERNSIRDPNGELDLLDKSDLFIE